MVSLRRKLSSVIGVATLTLAIVVATPVSASAVDRGNSVCRGGPIAAGTYATLTIAGFCDASSGNVQVRDNLTVLLGGGLNAAFAGSDIRVGGNVEVRSGGILILGCEPFAFTCFNDPDQNGGTLATNDTVRGDLIATGAMMVIAHHNKIGGEVSHRGGGGGVTCATQPLGPNGPPAYSTYEDNQVGSNLSITGMKSCWLGVIRNHVGDSVSVTNNVFADEDATEVVQNTIGGDLHCSGNDPVAQVGDSGGLPNTVAGKKTGECAAPGL